LPQLALQLGNLGPQYFDHRPKLRILGGKFLIRTTTIDRHHTMINGPAVEIN
jgi:hypothetical protein